MYAKLSEKREKLKLSSPLWASQAGPDPREGQAPPD